MPDLPCRLIAVVGVPSGGTSAATGTLTKNKFYNRAHDHRFFEDGQIAKLFRSRIFELPHRPEFPKTIHDFAYYMFKYKQEAIDAGFDRAVVKLPWFPLWEPELLIRPCGVEIEPLLVWRDPDETMRSLARRGMAKPDPHWFAHLGQERVMELHINYDWPLWEFGKTASVIYLEKALGVNLPKKHFDNTLVRG
jgi:hypothetical protein